MVFFNRRYYFHDIYLLFLLAYKPLLSTIFYSTRVYRVFFTVFFAIHPSAQALGLSDKSSVKAKKYLQLAYTVITNITDEEDKKIFMEQISDTEKLIQVNE